MVNLKFQVTTMTFWAWVNPWEGPQSWETTTGCLQKMFSALFILRPTSKLDKQLKPPKTSVPHFPLRRMNFQVSFKSFRENLDWTSQAEMTSWKRLSTTVCSQWLYRTIVRLSWKTLRTLTLLTSLPRSWRFAILVEIRTTAQKFSWRRQELYVVLEMELH